MLVVRYIVQLWAGSVAAQDACLYLGSRNMLALLQLTWVMAGARVHHLNHDAGLRVIADGGAVQGGAIAIGEQTRVALHLVAAPEQQTARQGVTGTVACSVDSIKPLSGASFPEGFPEH